MSSQWTIAALTGGAEYGDGMLSAAKDEDDDKRRRQLKEASQRSRKRQKRENMVHSTQISLLRSKVELLHSKLSTSVEKAVESVRLRAKERYELNDRVVFLKNKLEAHQRWVQDVRNLIMVSPLMDLGQGAYKPLTSDDENKFAELDVWRDHDTQYKIPVFAVHRLRQVVDSSVDNARKMLHELRSEHCAFPLRFNSRGWTFAASAQRQLLVFRAERLLALVNAKEIATEVWRSVQGEDILRTFVPMVQESAVLYEMPDVSLSRRVVQVRGLEQPQTIVTVESVSKSANADDEWQISIETCHDSCLTIFADEHPPPASAQDVEPQEAKDQCPVSSRINDLVLAASCRQEKMGVRLHIVGSAHYNGEYNDLDVNLLQHMVNMMPVYEDVHLLSKAGAAAGEAVLDAQESKE